MLRSNFQCLLAQCQWAQNGFRFKASSQAASDMSSDIRIMLLATEVDITKTRLCKDIKCCF
jgi:hypothetical protein